MNIFDNWDKPWFGFWKFCDSEAGSLPVFSTLVDPSWKPADMVDLSDYLQSAPISICLGRAPQKCPLCEELIPIGAQRSDGKWVWSDQLSHFVTNHNVRLPNQMVDHIREMVSRR